MAIFGTLQSTFAQANGLPRLQIALRFASGLILNGNTELVARAKQLREGDKFEVPIEGNEVFAIFQAYKPRERKDGFFEAHKEFTDIQFLLQGEEYVEVCPLENLSPNPQFDQNNNVFFPLESGAVTRLALKPGLLAVLFPDDAHAPCLCAGAAPAGVIKVVIKVRNVLN